MVQFRAKILRFVQGKFKRVNIKSNSIPSTDDLSGVI